MCSHDARQCPMVACHTRAIHRGQQCFYINQKGGRQAPRLAVMGPHMSGWCCFAFWKKAFLMSALLQAGHRGGGKLLGWIQAGHGMPTSCSPEPTQMGASPPAVPWPTAHLAPGCTPSRE